MPRCIRSSVSAIRSRCGTREEPTNSSARRCAPRSRMSRSGRRGGSRSRTSRSGRSAPACRRTARTRAPRSSRSATRSPRCSARPRRTPCACCTAAASPATRSPSSPISRASTARLSAAPRSWRTSSRGSVTPSNARGRGLDRGLRFRPVVLCILDGYGIGPAGPGNAIAAARHPRIDELLRGPHARLDASGRAVGLPDGVMGNSEVGHLTIGAGYAQRQDYVRINDDIASGAFARNPVLVAACTSARERRKALHLLGLVSDGGVHADYRHLIALLELARREGVARVFVHAFLDGRDMPPRSALPLLEEVQRAMSRLETGAYATVSGRYYAMDRDKRWDRTALAADAIVFGRGPQVTSVREAVERCYAQPECRDELM